MVLHAVGDTVGFRNGEWEFKQGAPNERILEKMYEFIDLGGVNGISLKDWIISDDTLMHIKTAEALLENYNSMNTLGQFFKDKFIEAFNQFIDEGIEKRYPGRSTMESIKKMKEGNDWNSTSYNFMSGGSGASMRTLCIGLAFSGEENRDKLIQMSIESGRMTNNSVVGFLGAFASALFTALAIEQKPIGEWPYILVDLIATKVMKYIKSVGRDVEHFEKDYHVFMNKWHRYIDDKFDENKKPRVRRSDKNLILRSNYYLEAFSLFSQASPHRQGNVSNSKNYGFIGSGGDDSVIIAYDCLFDAKDNWEKLIVYSMLHMGDTDTTGSIAAGLFGAMYGMDNIPKNFTDNLEYKDELINIGKNLYKKYNVK